MRLTNITRALEVPTASKVRTEDFYSLPGEKSYFATRNTHVACEYSLFSQLLAAWNVSPASQAVRSVQASSPIWASEASRARTRERSSEAARGQRNPSPPRPAPPRPAPPRPAPLSGLLSHASRASTFHDLPQIESLLAGYEERGETQCFL